MNRVLDKTTYSLVFVALATACSTAPSAQWEEGTPVEQEALERGSSSVGRNTPKPPAPWAQRLGDCVFAGEVLVDDVTSREGTMGRAQVAAIRSDVVLARKRILRDRTGITTGEPWVLPVLGGTVGRRSMRVSGAPVFRKGDHLFLVAFPTTEPGRFQVTTQWVFRIRAGRTYAYDTRPILSVNDSGIRTGPQRGSESFPRLVPMHPVPRPKHPTALEDDSNAISLDEFMSWFGPLFAEEQ